MANSDFTPNLGLPFLLSNQAQKHVTLNESLRALDGLVQIAVEDRDLAEPPESPADGARYLVAENAEGNWSGQNGKLAFYADNGWLFFAPQPGWQVFVADEARLLVHDGAEWQPVLPDAFQNLSLIGLGGVADASNPMLAKLNAALFTADEVANGGTGDLRFKLNKEAAGNVLSLLFQTGYSARAEIGLLADDDLVFKTSPDGAEFHEGLRIAQLDGRASFPNGVSGLRTQLTANRDYYVSPSGDDSQDGLSTGLAFATLQKAMDVVSGLDLGIFDVTIHLADGSYADETLVSGAFVGSGIVQITGNTSAPRNCLIETAGIPIKAQQGAKIRLQGVKLNSTAGSTCLSADEKAEILVNGAIVFGSGSRAHMSASNGATLSMATDYEIDGTAIRHAEISSGALYVNNNNTISFNADQNFSAGFVTAIRFCDVYFPNASFVDGGHTISGRRYQSKSKSIITVNGAGETYFPGDVAGLVADNGLYL